jgi:hypothetical protein
MPVLTNRLIYRIWQKRIENEYFKLRSRLFQAGIFVLIPMWLILINKSKNEPAKSHVPAFTATYRALDSNKISFL